jgi:hypothetical protein
MVTSLTTDKRQLFVNYFNNITPETKITVSYVFGNYTGLRLTFNGYMLFLNNFINYRFELQKEFIITPNKILKLNKLDKPYFLNKKILVLFGEEDYTSLIIMNDLDLWLDTL